jgi:hypothetical protein
MLVLQCARKKETRKLQPAKGNEGVSLLAELTYSTMKRKWAVFEDDDGLLLLFATRRTCLPYRERLLVPDFRLNILLMSDEESIDQFRFTPSVLQKLARLLKLPNVITTLEGVRTNPLEALAVCLRRMIFPKRWIDMAAMFGRAPSSFATSFTTSSSSSTSICPT